MAALRRGLGRRLKELRKAAGLTQEKLAAVAMIDSKYLGSIERGEKSASLEVLERIVLALKIEPYEPFLFSMSGKRDSSKIDEGAIGKLIQHSDKSTRSLLLLLADAVLMWRSTRKP